MTTKVPTWEARICLNYHEFHDVFLEGLNNARTSKLIHVDL